MPFTSVPIGIARSMFTLYSRVVWNWPRGRPVMTAQVRQVSRSTPYQPPWVPPKAFEWRNSGVPRTSTRPSSAAVMR